MPSGPQRIYRGEVRHILPTPEFPDPAKAAATDPHGVLEHWLSGSHPYTKGSGYGIWEKHPETGEFHIAPYNPISTGVHWSRSPQAIPERFTEGAFLTPQTGVAMPKSEASFIQASELLDKHEPTWGDTPEHIAKAERLVSRREREGTAAYRDLSGEKQRSKAFTMGVVWHGLHTPDMTDPDNPPTNYEDEVNIKPGIHVPITHARFHIPGSGEVTIASGNEMHPTPDVVLQGAGHGLLAPAYSHVHRRGFVPWSVKQFEGLHLPVQKNFRRMTR